MLRYTISRLVSLTLSLAIASLVIFAVIEVIPGDPASFMLGMNAADDTVAALREQLGLNGSVVQRYLSWVGGMLTGDLGTSYTYRVPVADLVSARMQVSLPLTAYALILSTVIAIPVGMIAAARQGKPTDLAVMGTTQLGVAVPNFWFAMLLVLIFAIKLRWFPSGGFPGWDK
ncbi:MAG: ABC transporter permease, partial [Gemmobacter sp.]|nr:ABC transporter permease [Gemmobacter sp.]